MKTFTVLAAALLAAFAYSFPSNTTSARDNKFRRSENAIAGQYVVVLSDESAASANDPRETVGNLVGAYPGTLRRSFTNAIRGYSVEMTEADAINLSKDPRVEFVEEDSVVTINTDQANATWGIDRIDQRALPLSTTYQYDRSGFGVNVYVLDTGVRPSHIEFGGRAQVVFDAVGDGQNGIDCNGHGTHVAGTIGGATSGVAKQVRLNAVRVLDCGGSGTVSGVIAGIDWVTANAVRPAVVNMSLGGDPSDALDAAVAGSIAGGLSYVLAAGNSNLDACNYSPGRVPSAITVAASDQSDARAFFSNFGSCVDIFAPGMWVVSAWISTDNTYASLNGTSMASPHVAGAAALILEQDPVVSPAELATLINSEATTGVLTSTGIGSPDRLLFSRIQTTPVPCSGTLLIGNVSSPTPSFQSSATGFPARAGEFRGELTASGSALLQLSLEIKKGRNWTRVAHSTASNGVEGLVYRGKSGTYRWRIDAQNGGGNYLLCSNTP